VGEVRYAGVEKRFDGVTALEAFDLDVPEGSFLVLLGPSGCGKTTALRILAGLEVPTAGSVHIGDRDVTRIQPRDRDVAMVFQSYALYPHMSVRENIGYPLKIRDVPRAERAEQVLRVASALEVDHLLDRRPRALSGGQRQRIALARAIIREPSVFLMDEPLSNLDAKLRTTMRGEIKRLQRRLEATTLYVTHDQTEAMTMADLVAVLRDGRLQQLAPPEELYERPANRFVATFVGNPPMNVLPGELDPQGSSFRIEGTAIPLGDRFGDCTEGGSVELGARPEDIGLVAIDAPGAVPAEVYVVEPMGNEVLVGALVGETRVTARAEKGFRARLGEPIGLAIDPDRACFFAADGTTVVHRAAERTHATNASGGDRE
jgi:multiple sugar transport system ATP-binding protein